MNSLIMYKFAGVLATNSSEFMKTMTRFLLLYLMLMPAALFAQQGQQRIEALIDERSYQKAEALLIEILKKDPDPSIKNKLGEVYGYQLKWDHAIDIYRELTLMYPKNADFFFRYGGVLAKKAQSSNTFLALAMLGRIKSSFRTALKLNPKHIGAHWAMIDLYVSLPGIVGGSMSKAHEYAIQLKELSPLDGYLALGYVYEYDDAPKEAKSNYLKALSMLNAPEALERNQLNYQIGKICSEYDIEMDRGIAHLNKYIENYTVLDGVPLEWAYLRLAKIYRKRGDKELALLWINKSLELDPDLQPALAEKSNIDQL